MSSTSTSLTKTSRSISLSTVASPRATEPKSTTSETFFSFHASMYATRLATSLIEKPLLKIESWDVRNLLKASRIRSLLLGKTPKSTSLLILSATFFGTLKGITRLVTINCIHSVYNIRISRLMSYSSKYGRNILFRIRTLSSRGSLAVLCRSPGRLGNFNLWLRCMQMLG